MKRECEYRDRIQDLVGGIAPPEEIAALTAHLAECPTCAALARDVERLDAAAAALPDAIPPAQDLWPGISDRIAAGVAAASARPAAPPRRRRAGGLRIGLALAAVVAGLLLMSRIPTGTGSRPDPAAALADGYGTALAACELSLDGIAGRLDPDDVRALRSGVAEIERAVAETRGALADVRGDPVQTRRLAAGFHRKIDLMQRLASQTVRS